MKTCDTCKIDKSLNEFNKKKTNKDGLQRKCRDCQKQWYKNYYNTVPKEKERILARTKANRDLIRDLVKKAKSVPCIDCKIQYPYYVMDFDHLNDKEFTIAYATSVNYSLDKITREIAKCEVVCSNCHRIRTYERRSASQISLAEL